MLRYDDDMMMIDDLLAQIEISVSSKLYHVALFAALTIPDICGAVDSENGRAVRYKYIQWFDTYVAPRYSAWGTQYLTGEECYRYRCIMLHQGRAHYSHSRYLKTMFVVASQENLAYCGAFTVDDGGTLCIDISRFCRNTVMAAHSWLEEVEDTDRFEKNTTEFMELFRLSFG